MDCTRVRDAVSARFDGEDGELSEPSVRAHLRRCAACRAYRDRIAELQPAIAGTPVLRTATARIVGEVTRGRSSVVEWPVRVALFALALAQLLLAVPGLIFGADDGAPLHVAHEAGSWEVALAVGFIFVAWRPLRAVGMLPFVTALSCMLVATAAIDLAHGHAEALFETTHLLEVLGSLLLWYLAHPVSPRNFTARASTREPMRPAERQI
jgi:predicted anti-sigma-YlaC factor YlaD